MPTPHVNADIQQQGATDQRKALLEEHVLPRASVTGGIQEVGHKAAHKEHASGDEQCTEHAKASLLEDQAVVG